MNRIEDQEVLVVQGTEFKRFEGVSAPPLNPSKKEVWSDEMTEVAAKPSADRKKPQLPALSGLRLFVALHIYVFHIMQAHQAGLLKFAVLDALPSQLGLLLRRGFVSTGLFFQLSGLLLAYAYLDASGRLEELWSKFKGQLRRIAVRTKDGLYKAVGETLDSVMIQDILGWFNHSGLYATDG